MTRHRAGHWWPFHGPAAGLRLTRRFGAAPYVRVKYPCDQRTRRGESHSQTEGFQIEGGPTPYPPHCSMCYSADVDLQQTDGLYAR
jgi:hypothetical protein